MAFRHRKPRHTQAHDRNYRTLYIVPEVIEQIDVLKARWGLKGRGKVIERIVREQYNRQERKTNEDALKSRI